MVWGTKYVLIARDPHPHSRYIVDVALSALTQPGYPLAVVGSMILLISVTTVAGKPLRSSVSARSSAT